MIDSTAIVHADARLGTGVSIGPNTVIEAGVEIGDDTWIGPNVIVRGHTRIGARNRIFQFCSIGEDPQHAGYGGEDTALEIGDGNVIREYCTLNRGSSVGSGLTRIGHDNFLMAYVHVAHDCQIGNNTIFVNCSSLAGHVLVGDYAILGGFTLVHQFCRIGVHCITGAGSVCLKDVPPYVVAMGNTATPHGINVKGLRRRGFGEETIAALRRAYRHIYRSGIDLRTAIEKLQAEAPCPPEVALFINFIKASERGIIR